MGSKRLGALASLVIATAAVTMALAQPRRAPKPKSKPPVVTDAGDAPSMDEPPVGTASGGQDAGAAPSPVARPEVGNAGIKGSPLNPTASELTGTMAVDAGAIDYDRLLGDIAALRARVAAVGDTLFHARIAVLVETDDSHAKIGRFSISLDDGVVYTAPANFHASDLTAVYSHAVAPGRHAVTVDVDRQDDHDAAFRSSQKTRFVVDVPKDEELTLEVRVWDDSTMGADFPGDRSGRYELRVRAKAVSKPVKR